MQLAWTAHSEIGLVRKDNQDSGYASDRLLVVADGMGGAARGDLASAVAIDAFTDIDTDVSGEAMLDTLQRVVEKANDTLADLVYDDPSLDGMGTTVCGAMFDGEQLGVVHIGDSRGYLLRDGELIRLTNDHSWVQSLIDDGRLTPEEALYHPHRNLLLKVLNGQPTNVPDLFLHDAEPGDRLLFCSDGLCGLVDDDTIAKLLATPNRNESLRELITVAHEAGGVDNITILIGDLGDEAGTSEPVVLGAAKAVEIPDTSRTQRYLGADTADTASDHPASEPTPVSRQSASDIVLNEDGEPEPPSDAVLDPEDARYSPRPPSRRRWLLWLLTAIIALGVLAAAVALARESVRSHYYVGAASDKVAIYRGAPDKIGPFTISELEEQTGTYVADLPPRYQEDVRHHAYQNQSLASARTTVLNLNDKADACKKAREARARATTAPTPTPTPTATPSPDPSATPAPSPTPSATPTSIPTPPAASDEC